MCFQLKVQPQYHYGDRQSPWSKPDHIPDDEELLFEIELLDYMEVKVSHPHPHMSSCCFMSVNFLRHSFPSFTMSAPKSMRVQNTVWKATCLMESFFCLQELTEDGSIVKQVSLGDLSCCDLDQSRCVVNLQIPISL